MFWAVEVESGRALLAESTARAKQLGKRFHALMDKIAADHGCGVDSTFDLPRVFRAAGGVNYKDPENPVPVRCFAGNGNPLTVEQITAALDAAGIPEEPATTKASGKKQREKKSRDDTPPLYAVSAAMTPGGRARRSALGWVRQWSTWRAPTAMYTCATTRWR